MSFASKRGLWVAVLLLAGVGAAMSDGEVQKDSVKYRFNPIVVTATKVAGPQTDIAASISVLDEELIRLTNATSVLDLVKDFVPGVHITERAVMGYGVARGAAGGISIRGVGGSPVTGVLVLRDGRPDIMGMMGHPIPDAYALEGVERIEVVRGPASFLYGTNAMGGVINIVSKRMSQDGFSTRVTAGVGSFASRKLSVQHGGKSGRFEYYLTAGTRLTDGHRDFSNYEGDFYTAHVGYAVNARTRLSLNANLSNVYLLDPGPVQAPVADHWYDLRRSGVDLTLTRNGSLGETYLRLHGNFGRHKIYDGWRSHDRTVGFMFYHNAKFWKGNITTVGFDVKRYGGEAEETLNKVPVIDYSERFITEYAPYIHTQQLFLKRFIASAGVRVEHHPLYGYEVIPKWGLVTHLGPGTSLRASAAKGFRSPAIRELYVFPPRNENLRPERLWNYEIGLSQNLGGTVRIDANFFRAEGENMIRLVAPPPQFVNSGQFVHTGYEITLDWVPFSGLHFGAAWTKLDLDDQTMNTPGKKLTAFINYRFGRVHALANLVHVRDLFGADFYRNRMEDYTVLNLAVDVDLISSLGLRLGLKNALDAEYQTLYGYPMPGRQFTLDLQYNL